MPLNPIGAANNRRAIAPVEPTTPAMAAHGSAVEPAEVRTPGKYAVRAG
jgi:hypothetical protein